MAGNTNIIAIVAAIIAVAAAMYFFGIEAFSSILADSGIGSGGSCSSDSECSNFGSTYCSGADNVRCASDSLCHCCLTVCYGGTDCSCIPNSGSGCSGGTEPYNGVCIFSSGGSPND